MKLRTRVFDLEQQNRILSVLFQQRVKMSAVPVSQVTNTRLLRGARLVEVTVRNLPGAAVLVSSTPGRQPTTWQAGASSRGTKTHELSEVQRGEVNFSAQLMAADHKLL